MKPTPYVGEFEYAVLLALLHLEGTDDAYAVPVRTLLESRTGRPVARGALYTALERLETPRAACARGWAIRRRNAAARRSASSRSRRSA